MISRRAATLLLFAVMSRAASAQAVRGLVVDATGKPISGVVAALVDSLSRQIARSLSTTAGEIYLRAPEAGTYRVRTLRIGFRPTETERIQLTADGVVIRRFVLQAAVPLALDTVRVSDHGACRRYATDSTAVVFSAWEQARAALIATQLTAASRGVTATAVDFKRVLESNSNRIRSQVAHVRTESVRQPWRSLTPDSLRRNGYVLKGPGDSVTYHAPGLDVLLDATFTEDHCIRISNASNASTLGIDFEPVPERTRIPEIRGSLWLDRRSSELQRLEFRYLNIPPEEAQVAAGDMTFSRLKNGGWVVSRWQIHMPVLERTSDQYFRGQRISDAALRVSEIHVSGGALITVLAGRDTVWSHVPVRLEGVVLDSVSRRPVSQASVVLRGTESKGVVDVRGHFLIPRVLPGEYTIDVRTPGLDSLNAVFSTPIIVEDSATSVELRVPTGAQMQMALCPSLPKTASGILIGRLATGLSDSLPIGARVFAEWEIIRLKDGAGSPVVVRERQSAETSATPDGSFRFCGVPMNTSIMLTAAAEGLESPRSIEARIPPFTQFARVEVPVVRTGTAAFSGTVVDSTLQPIAGVEVSLPEFARTTFTDARGAFVLADLAAGTQRVLVRRLGLRPLDTAITVRPGERLSRRIVLSRATVLAPVEVTTSVLPRSMMSFEDHRKVGLGHFLDRAQLARLEPLSMSAVLGSFSGLQLARGRGDQAWAIRGRGTQSLGLASLRRPDAADSLVGAKSGCYANVYLDKALIYSGRDREPLFNVNSIHPDQLEAVEYYAGPSQTPGEYNTLDSTCGVLVLWTRVPRRRRVEGQGARG